MRLGLGSLGFGRGLGRWTVARLFSGQSGIHADLSDLSTLYQDDAGTTPVTAVGQTVSRINDKDGRGTYALVRPSGITLEQESWGKNYLSFDGSANYIDIIDSPSLERQAISVAFVNRTADASLQKVYFTRSGGSQGFTFQQESGNVKLYADPDLVDSGLALTDYYPIRQLKIVSSGSGALVMGLDVKTASATALTALTLTQPYEIGGRSTETTFRISGPLYEFFVVGREINSSEIWKTAKYYRDRFGTGYGQLIMDGNSLTAGSGATATTNYPYQCATLLQGLQKQYHTENFGVGGQTTPQMISDAATQIDVLYDGEYTRNLLVAWEATNDLYYGATAAEAYDNIVTYCQARQAAGWTVGVMTVLPRSDGGLPASFEADRQTVNTNIRANWATFADKLLDIAADSRLGDEGDNLDLTYYSGDKVHLVEAGYTIVAELVRDWVITL